MTPTQTGAPDLDAAAIKSQLTTRYVGRVCESYAEIDSTNRRAVELARAGTPNGTAVLADRQTAGRGRLGRKWLAPAASSLLISVVLRPQLLVHQAQRVTMISTLAMVEAVHEVTGLEPRIKWPNDLLLDGHKLGGVLTELGLCGKQVDYAVPGTGLNVNLDVDALAETIVGQEGGAQPASLMHTLGRPVARLDVAVAYLIQLETRMDALAEGWSPHTAWRQHLDTLGRQVHVGTGDEVIHGLAEDVDADGKLLVRQADGVLRRIVVGDVTLRGHIIKRQV